jgi:FkbM family methyltransferase
MDIDVDFQLALRYFQAGNLQQAEDILKKILEVQSNNIDAINLLGIISYRQKDYDSAIKYSRKLINLTLNSAGAYYILGHSLQEKGEADEAITCYEESLRLNPYLVNAYYNLGTIFQDKNEIDKAISCYQKALQLDPTDTDTYYNLGLLLQGKGNLDEAVIYYQKALQFNPSLAEAYNNIGMINQEKGQLDEAMTCYEKALQINPDLLISAINLMQLSKMKAIKRLLQKENPLILEIGSHVGSDTDLFLKSFRDTKLFCFEPDPRCITKFKKKVKDNRSTLVEVAVSNTDGTILLNLSGGFNPDMPATEEWDASSSIKKSISHCEDFPWLTFDSTIEVKTIKLDTWVIENNINEIDFIWSDIQGAERDFIEGATNTLKITKYVYMEYGAISTYPEAMTRDETITLMKRHDFEIIRELSDTGKSGNLLFKNSKS